MRKDEFTVSNIAGGGLRTFRLSGAGSERPSLSAVATRYALEIGFGGPAFGGPAGDAASDAWDEWVATWDDQDR